MSNSDVSNAQQMVNDYISEQTGKHGQWNEHDDKCPFCKVDGVLYAYSGSQTLYCCNCSKQFSLSELMEQPGSDTEMYEYVVETDDDVPKYLSAEIGAVSEAAKKIIDKSVTNVQTPKYTYTNTSGVGWKGHSHPPTHVLTGSNFGVWVGKKDDVSNFLDKFDLVINLTWSSVKQTHNIPIPELKQYESYGSKFEEIHLDWPDYGIVYLPRQFWVDLYRYISEKGKKTLIFCQGGHGRTGTALACLFVAGLGWDGAKAIEWVRKHYCKDAIETFEQERYVRSVHLQSLLPESKVEGTEPVELTLPEPKMNKEYIDKGNGELEVVEFTPEFEVTEEGDDTEYYCNQCKTFQPFEHIHVSAAPNNRSEEILL